MAAANATALVPAVKDAGTQSRPIEPAIGGELQLARAPSAATGALAKCVAILLESSCCSFATGFLARTGGRSCASREA